MSWWTSKHQFSFFIYIPKLVLSAGPSLSSHHHFWSGLFLLSLSLTLFLPGLSCDRCEFGYWNLSHPDGCVPCDCDPLGSFSPFCEPEAGHCQCKPGVGGRRCDSCGRGSYGLKLEGSCTPCNCSQEGTVPGTDCDPHTGQCVCKASYSSYFSVSIVFYLTVL